MPGVNSSGVNSSGFNSFCAHPVQHLGIVPCGDCTGPALIDGDVLEQLVFTGCIGEHGAAVRAEVCDRLCWVGVMRQCARQPSAVLAGGQAGRQMEGA